MIRLILGISILVTFTVYGGWAGFICGLVMLAVVGIFLPPRSHYKQTWEDVEQMSKPRSWERTEQARRGSEVDPTRPDDPSMWLAHEIERRKS